MSSTVRGLGERLEYAAQVLPSGLSMLWEQADPETALLHRFGFGGFDHVVDWITTSVSQAWNLTVHDCSRLVISDHNAIAWAASDRGDLVIKWSHMEAHFAGLAASTQLLRRLGNRGVPVAMPIPSAVGEDRAVVDGPVGSLSVAVLPELDGTWLDVSEPTTVRAAGSCLARVHLALDGYSDQRLWRPALFEPPDRRLRRWLSDHDPKLAPAATARLSALVNALPPLSGSAQPVHNDFRSANILARDGRIVGILDFDDVAWDHPVCDLAKASVYLGTLFRNWQPTPASVRRELWTGFEAVRPLAATERRWLEVLTLWHAIAAVPYSHDPAVWAEAL